MMTLNLIPLKQHTKATIFLGKLGFLNWNVIYRCVVNMQFGLLEFEDEEMNVIETHD